MAGLDKGLKQRIVGALVLVALAVIFLPIVFSRENEPREVSVLVPPMPDAAPLQSVAVEPAELPDEAFEHVAPALESVPEVLAVVVSEPLVQPSAPIEVAKSKILEAPASGLDARQLPISWSVQLASLSSRPGAEKLQQNLRSGGYNAYIRAYDGMNRVFVGPVPERAEADRLRDQLNRQQRLNGFVVRYAPENR